MKNLHVLIAFYTVFKISEVDSRACLPGWQAGPGDNNCYLFKLTTKSWDDALDVCKGMKSSLVTIETMEKEAWIKTATSRMREFDGTVKWWVGSSRAPGASTPWVWTDGSALNSSLIPWLPGDPHLVKEYGSTAKLCGLYHNQPLGLKDKLCTIQNSYICQRSLDAASFCDTVNGWFEHHEICYKYFNTRLPWNEARLDCERDGAILASPLTSVAEQSLFDIVKEKHSEIWLGLHTKVVGSVVSWNWVDGSSFGNTFWTPGQPFIIPSQRNSSCATVNPSVEDFRKAWIVRPCDGGKSYVCQKPEGSCAPGWKSFAEKCYQFNIKFFLTWDDALKHCQLQGAKLLGIENEDTQAFINTYLEEFRRARIDYFWIGLNDPDGTGVYSWSDGRKLIGYQNFPTDKRIPSGDRTCLYISTATTNGTWVSGSCLAVRSFVCQAATNKTIKAVTTPPPTYTCEEDWISPGNGLGNQCYLFNDTEVTWPEASQSCQAMGGNLVRVTDIHVQSFINEHLTKSKWIGLNDLAKEGTVVWLNDTTQPTFFNLDNRHGNDVRTNCAFVADGSNGRLSTLGRWVMTSCTNTHGFICQKQAANVGELTLPMTTTAVAWTSGCDPGWEQNGQFCYMFREEQKTWSDARLVCKQNGGDLASIVDGVEQSYVTGRLKSLSSAWLWIGAQDLTVEGGWQWADNSPLAFISWAPGQPDNMANSDCAAMYVVDGAWNDLTCDTQNGFICKKTAVLPQTSSPAVTLATVPDGMKKGCERGWSEFAGYCYRIRYATVTWTDALKSCIQQDANLVSVRDVNEQNYIYSQLRHDEGPAWIGLNSRRKVRSYEWADNTPVTYTHWGRGEPNNRLGGTENCAVFNLHKLGFWSDVDCNLPSVSGYICKKPQTLSPTGTPSSDVGCSENWVGYGSQCYIFVETPKTFADAESLCKQGFGHLAMVKDRYIQAFLSGELGSRSGDYWIGLQTYRTGSSYYYWIDRSRVRYTNWDRSHTGRETHSCASITADRYVGLWKSSPCATTRKAFICQGKRTLPSTKPPPSTVPPVRCRRNYAEYFGFCYRLLTTARRYTWFEAVNACNREGANPLSLHNSSDVGMVRTHLIRYSSRRVSYWLGLNIIDRSKGYSWSDGSPFSYTMWATGQPDNHNDQEDCVEWNSRSNTWTDVSCYARRAVICSYKKGALPLQPTVPPTKHPGINCGSARNWQYFNGSCYYISSAGKNWFGANDYCRRTIGGDLLSIANPEENNFILETISRMGGSIYWTGLNELRLEGLEWSDGEPLVFINWEINEPNDDFGGQRCVQINNGNGFWHDGNCGRTTRFICKQPNGTRSEGSVTPSPELPGYCHKGWTSYGNKCYKVFGIGEIGEGVNWTTALNSCRSMGKGYDMVAMNSATEQLFLTLMLRGYNSSYWIGLNQLAGNRLFLWTDNSGVSYSNWDRGEPNGNWRYASRRQNCVEIRTHEGGVGKWADNRCAVTQGYICQSYKDSDAKLPVTKPLPSWCREGFTVFGKSCYMILKTNQTWNEAITTCTSHGGNLASVEDQFEENFIRVLNEGQEDFLWIGMSDRDIKGIYRWSDGWPVTYTHWGRGEPSRDSGEGCVAMLTDGTWTDTVCNHTYASVCEINSGIRDLRVYNDIRQRIISLLQVYPQLLTPQPYTPVIRFKIKGIYRWSDGWPVTYTHWGRGEPSRDSGEGCVAMLTDGTWTDTVCNHTYASVCEINSVTPAPYTTPVPTYCRNNAWVQFGGFCYLVVSSYTTWPEAHFNCKQRGMRLATIHSRKQTDFLVNLIHQKRLRYDVWIGMVNAQRAGFKWDDGTPVSFTNWGNNEPSNARTKVAEYCVQMQRSSGFWDDRDCRSRRYSLCMTESVVPTPSTTESLSTTSSTSTPTTRTTTRSSSPMAAITSTSSTVSTASTTSSTAATRKLSASTRSSSPVLTKGAGERSTPAWSRGTPSKASVDNRHTHMMTSSHAPNNYRSNPSPSKPGALKPGAVAGISVGVCLAVLTVTLGIIYAKRKGRNTFTPKTSKQSLRFDNALYNEVNKNVSLQ